MPIYEYQCQACGYHFEKMQRMTDDPLKDCPKCDKAALNKLVSAPSFKLKGTGWYETDFKNQGGKKTDASASGSGDTNISDRGDSKASETASTSQSPSGQANAKQSNSNSGASSGGKNTGD